MTTTESLYTVRSTGIVNGFEVPIEWFAARAWEDIELAWPELIAGYDPKGPEVGHQKALLRELLTEAEAKALLAHLEQTDPEGRPAICSFELPINSDCGLPFDRMPELDGGRITFPLPKSPLPFPVMGYCRLGGLLVRVEKTGGFTICWNEDPISKPFADRAEAEVWASRLELQALVR